MKNHSSLSRRNFLRLTGLTGAGLALGFVSLPGEESKIINLSQEMVGPGTGLTQYIFIASTGKITLFNHRPEMGQGTFQAIPMILAEELCVSMDQVVIEASPADRSLYGDQMVVGSRSIQSNYLLMRKMGAAAREMLKLAAAQRWNSDASALIAKNAMILHPDTGQKFSYAELAEDAGRLTVPQNPPLKYPKDFQVIGKSLPRADIPVKTNGDAKFGLDIRVPGMLTASIERSPVFHGRVLHVDDSATRAVPGVKHVFQTRREVFGKMREGVAVLAENYWAASEGRKLLKITWDTQDLEKWDSEKIWEDFRNSRNQAADVLEEKGNFETAFSAGVQKIEASYETPYQTHAPMEPMNAVVSVKNDQCEFWGSTQNPNGVRSFLASKLGIPEKNVTIHYTFMGGAFGRRSLTDVAEEAADLSKQAGVPVKVIWSREDDLTQGPFRACSLNIFRGALDAEGRAIALEHKVICQDIRNQSGPGNRASQAMAGGINTEYEIPHYRINGILKKIYIPISYWRSVYHSTNCFAHESFIDELAITAKKDPLDFRLSLLKNHRRYTDCLHAVARMSDWYSPRKDTGKGVAVAERSGAYVAMVAEVQRINGRMVPIKIFAAIDCGTPVNPDIIRAQTEGCMVMGLTAAYKSGLTIRKGGVSEQNFDSYPLLRIQETPEMIIEVMNSTESPEGAGEGGLPTVAPAICNAIFDLTGKRVRSLPFRMEEV